MQLSIFISLFFVLPNYLIGQHYFRLKADFSIKEKFYDGKMSLSRGSVYFDKVHDKLVYKISFPEKELWVFKDTTFYRFVDNTLKSKQMVPFNPAATMFSNLLNKSMHNFGLEKSLYKIEKVEKEGDLVITTWKPDQKVSKMFGKVITSKKNNQLYGVAFYTTQNELIKKQFFKEYIKVAGIEFPTDVTEIHYLTQGKDIKQTTYRNIVINDMKDEDIYNFKLPAR
ncbi:MAG: hypothetical protein ACK4GL_02240 [Flavobacteriales bacterium]